MERGARAARQLAAARPLRRAIGRGRRRNARAPGGARLCEGGGAGLSFLSSLEVFLVSVLKIPKHPLLHIGESFEKMKRANEKHILKMRIR